MRSVEEHLASILEATTPLEPLEVGLLGSVGCVLAQDVTSDDEVGVARVLLPRGTAIGARHIALLAAAGLGRVLVHPKPRVVVLTVGDNLVNPGDESLDSDVPDINGMALTSAATDAGAMTFRVGPLASNAESLEASIEDQLVRADIIVTACGMSAADYDLLTSVLRNLGHMNLVRVDMQPGGAQGFGRIGPDATPIFVLPGNPVSALLSFDLFVRSLIRRLMGHDNVQHQIVSAVLDTAIEGSDTDTRFVRANLAEKSGELHVRGIENEGANALVGLGSADAMIVVPPGTKKLAAGDKVTVMQLDK